MAVKRNEKKRFLQIAALLKRANENVYLGFGQNTDAMMLDALSQSQETALLLGNGLEAAGKEDLVPLLEAYCEDLYGMSQKLHSKKQMTGLYKKIKKELTLLYNRMEAEIETERLCFVFLPYKVSMWDTMESVWRAADQDPDCDAYVVPIPYFDKDQDGNLDVEHYEGDQYPSDVPITDYRSFRLEEKRPDAVFIHNPYDQNNLLTSVHPDFYSVRLKKYADQLIYIPYYTTADTGNVESPKCQKISEGFVIEPGPVNADCIVTANEQERELFLNILCSGIKGVPAERWETSVQNFGSPKIERAIRTKRQDERLPEAWNACLYGPDGMRKKTVFYNLSIEALLSQPDMMKKIEDTFAYFKARNDLTLWLRPHPLYEQTMKVLRPQLLSRYKELLAAYEEEGWGILDQGVDLDLAVASCDCYYGDYSSVAPLFWETGKAVLYQEPCVNGKEETIPCRPGACWEETEDMWFVLEKGNLLFHYDKQKKQISCKGNIPGERAFQENLFRSMVRVEDKLYLIPYYARNLAVYEIGTGQFTSIPVRGVEHFPKQPLFIKGVLAGSVLYCMPAWYDRILCLNLESGQASYIMADQVKMRGIPGCFGAAVSIGKNILCPQTYKKRWMILNTETGELSWHGFADPQREITSAASCGDALVLFDAKTGSILKETRGNAELEELFRVESDEVQLSAASETEVIVDDLSSGTSIRIDLDGNMVWKKERRELGYVQKSCCPDILPEQLRYVEKENEVLTLDSWLSLCDRIPMPEPDRRNSGELICQYVKNRLS